MFHLCSAQGRNDIVLQEDGSCDWAQTAAGMSRLLVRIQNVILAKWVVSIGGCVFAEHMTVITYLILWSQTHCE